MCGINGVIHLGKKNIKKEFMRNLVHDMNEKIIHRGPDSEGLYADERCAVGMRRLAIIDISTGAQPIYNSDNTKLIVFNGEIYNYRRLREELIAAGCIFRTKTDTEVVLLGIEKYGTGFLSRLDGMFAFCIYDLQNDAFLFARDRAGEKPLYFYKDQDLFLFASELKSIISTGLVPKEIDAEAMTTYFQLAYIPAPKSIIKNVSKLMPGEYMYLLGNGDIRHENYWTLMVTDKEEYRDYDWCKKRLREYLFESVENRMVADVPLGAFLSGGFDSAIVVGIMSSLSKSPINTFTVGFKEKYLDESHIAGIVAKKNGTNHHNIVLDWEETVKGLDDLLDSIDEPFADPSLIAVHAISKLTKQYVSVALTGDASDELFGGYSKYLMGYYSNLYEKMPTLIKNLCVDVTYNVIPRSKGIYRKMDKVIANAGALPSERAKYLMCRGFSYRQLQELIPGIEISNMDFIRHQFDALSDEDEQKRQQYVDFHTVLEGQMLPKTDRGAMLASLETRIPMLNPDIVELAYNMPSSFKIRKKKQKIILKDTFKDLLPDELFHSSKHGFDVPLGKWLLGPLRSMLENYSSEKFIRCQGVFDRGFINTFIKNSEPDNVDWATKLWTFFVFQHWYSKYIAA